jgi:hypothetical protein
MSNGEADDTISPIDYGEVHEGMATCPHVHEWFVLWQFDVRVIRAKYGDYYERVRTVSPENFPICGERFDSVSDT